MEKKIQILMVEEDQDFVEATRQALAASGYEVTVASSCEEGLSKLKESPPDLIIANLIMNKRGEGILFARKVRRNSQFKAFSRIPLLMLSDIKQQTEIDFPSPTQHAFFLPIDEFMEKPLSPEALVQKVEDLLHFPSR